MSNGNQASIAINDDLILDWYTYRKDQAGVGTILTNAGNKFSFSQSAYTGDIHLYVGYNPSTSELSVTEIYAADDTVNNTQCLSIESLGTVKENIGNINPVFPVNNDSIELTKAQEWIGNWIDNTTRQAYLQQCFANGNDSVLMVFVINQMDFDNGTVHTGYLGLEQDSSGNYIPHIILLNEDQVNNQVNLEDMTRVVPPMWSSGNFGLLKKLNIH